MDCRRLRSIPSSEGREVDFRVIGTPLLLECDGWTYHGLNRVAFERDRQSDAQLSAAGWIVIRFTYRAITRSPRATAERIQRNLTRWSNLPAPDAS
jgi:very-short-patch-repair endonuclease